MCASELRDRYWDYTDRLASIRQPHAALPKGRAARGDPALATEPSARAIRRRRECARVFWSPWTFGALTMYPECKHVRYQSLLGRLVCADVPWRWCSNGDVSGCCRMAFGVTGRDLVEMPVEDVNKCCTRVYACRFRSTLVGMHHDSTAMTCGRRRFDEGALTAFQHLRSAARERRGVSASRGAASRPRTATYMRTKPPARAPDVKPLRPTPRGSTLSRTVSGTHWCAARQAGATKKVRRSTRGLRRS